MRLRRRSTNSGQATLEYILVLFFSVFIFVTFFKGVLAPAISKAWTQLNTQVTSMFQGSNLHTYHPGVSQ